jgi:hypothetical protein
MFLPLTEGARLGVHLSILGLARLHLGAGRGRPPTRHLVSVNETGATVTAEAHLLGVVGCRHLDGRFLLVLKPALPGATTEDAVQALREGEGASLPCVGREGGACQFPSPGLDPPGQVQGRFRHEGRGMEEGDTAEARAQRMIADVLGKIRWKLIRGMLKVGLPHLTQAPLVQVALALPGSSRSKDKPNLNAGEVSGMMKGKNWWDSFLCVSY